jgi:hypothetical protein
MSEFVLLSSGGQSRYQDKMKKFNQLRMGSFGRVKSGRFTIESMSHELTSKNIWAFPIN